jgi:hypothetical protein
MPTGSPSARSEQVAARLPPGVRLTLFDTVSAPSRAYAPHRRGGPAAAPIALEP